MKKLCLITWITFVIILWFRFFKYQDSRYLPEYEKLNIISILEQEEIKEADYELLFLQTGLSADAIDLFLAQNKREEILEIQSDFFQEQAVEYQKVFGSIIVEDIEMEKVIREDTFLAVQPGDIIMTTSVHAIGYYHGHIGIILNNEEVLAAIAIGEKSKIIPIYNWAKFTNYVVLRLSDMEEEQLQQILVFIEQHLMNLPYCLHVGLVGDKYVSYDTSDFGVHCAYLVWYAFYQAGIDLDGDGGKIVTPQDILDSEQVEIVQMYGMNPTLLKERVCDTLGAE